MDDPVTDVVIVSDVSKCPEGYTAITVCPCGRNAQLWEKVYGGADNTRYLCFTKGTPFMDAEKEKDLVVEALYIPGVGSSYLMPGYEILTRTVEGDRYPIRHRQLAIKKVPRAEASKVVVDITIAKGKISKMYQRLDKVNDVCIYFRQVDYKPKQRNAVNDLWRKTKDLSVSGQAETSSRTTSDSTALEQPHPKPIARARPKPVTRVGPKPVTRVGPIEEVATVKTIEVLTSAPPPSALPEQTTPTQHNLTAPDVSGSRMMSTTPQSHQFQRPDYTYNVPVGTYPPPAVVSTPGPASGQAGSSIHSYPPQLNEGCSYNYHTQSQGYPPPPESMATSTQEHGYPPPPESMATSTQQHGYPPPPESMAISTQQHGYPPPPESMATSTQQHGYPPPPGGVATSTRQHGYPPPPGTGHAQYGHTQYGQYPPQQQGYPSYQTPSTVGYDTNIGFSFGGGAVPSYPPSQHGHPQYPPSGQPSYGSGVFPGGPGHQDHRQPPPTTQYGFNF